MKSSSLPLHAPRPRQLALALVLALPMLAHAGVEIDQIPLTVGKPLEPNIMFIMDDSGSMNWEFMPGTDGEWSGAEPKGLPYRNNLPPDIRLRASNVNTLWYNPRTTYVPWRKADGSNWPDADPAAVIFDPSGAIYARSHTINLGSSAIWPRIDRSNFNLVDPTSTAATTDISRLKSVSYYAWRYRGFYVLSDTGVATNPRDYYRYDFRFADGRWQISRTPITGTSGTGTSRTYTEGAREVLTTLEWGGGITRTVSEEIQNYANWLQYYRTRINMAKASSSQAFAGLGEHFRLGYNTIHNRRNFPIPVASNNGLFAGENREEWFENLFASIANSGTPLREALGRAGDYYSGSGPYGDSDGNQLSCRQNFAILTTDGYWNGDPAELVAARRDNDSENGPEITDTNGNVYRYVPERPFRDDRSNTLADVAMYYWKTDLRPDLVNDVPVSVNNPAFWQHMSTFGVSIGEKGTLDPKADLPDLTDGTKLWPAPDGRSGYEKAANIDDLWHATVNSRGNFIVATDPAAFTEALRDTLDEISSNVGRSASGAASSTSVDVGTMTYFADYKGGSWSGDVRGYEIDPSTGRASTAPDSGWVASEVLPIWDARKIFFNKGGTLTAFTWGNLSGTQRTALGSEAVVNYLRGDRSNEITEVPPGGTLRPRDSALGSFVNSQPVYVGKPPFSHYYENASTPGADSYNDHAASKASRTPVLYVGGNDGMLHGFNAETGVETFAFVPSSVINETLRGYSNPEYEHHYFVDGELTVAEAYVDGAWRTILVGSLGRGGRGVFALDVTNPDSVSLLWEKSASDIPALGNVIGKPIIAEVGPGSDWRAVFGNGPNGSGDKAQLISISLNDGSVSVIDTGEGGDNGLSAPLVWDADKNGTFETVYAGDLKGNVWRFNNIYEGSPPTPFHLFTTDGNRPITASPWAAVNQRDLRTWVFVGTGQYLNESDRASTATQTWYGLIDENETIGGRATELVERRVNATGTVDGRKMRTIESGSASQMAGKKGWYIDFTETGERMITPNMFYGSALIGTTFIPDGSDLCKPGGRSALWGIDPFTGASLRKKLFNNYGTLGGEFPGVLDDLKPILVGNPPVTISEDGERTTVVIHTDPEEAEEFTPPAGDAEGQSWREVVGQ